MYFKSIVKSDEYIISNKKFKQSLYYDYLKSSNYLIEYMLNLPNEINNQISNFEFNSIDTLLNNILRCALFYVDIYFPDILDTQHKLIINFLKENENNISGKVYKPLNYLNLNIDPVLVNSEIIQ